LSCNQLKISTWSNVRFSNRPFGVKRFQTIRHHSVGRQCFLLLTDEFREALTNARLTDEVYPGDMEGIDKDADDYLDNPNRVEAEGLQTDRTRI
jgi:hypothetical protein